MTVPSSGAAPVAAGVAEQIRILVCSANLGNAQPDNDSLASWIPRDGRCGEVIHPDPVYPLQMADDDDHHHWDFEKPSVSASASAVETLSAQLGGGDGEDKGDDSSSSGQSEEGLEKETSSSDRAKGPSNSLAKSSASQAGEDETNGEREEAASEAEAKKKPLTDSERVKLSTERKKQMARSLAVWAKVLNRKVAAASMVKRPETQDENRRGPRRDQLEVDETDQFDIIVVGMQEATFDPPSGHDSSSAKDLSETETEGNNIRVHLPVVQPIQQGAKRVGRGAERVGKELGKGFGKGAQKIAGLTQDRDYIKQTKKHLALTRRDWAGGSACLHAMIDAQLPSYERIVSYQRGQMRLEVYCNSNNIEVEVLHTCAHNTGRGGLANKGGIVTELLINGNTKISFMTAHLEAHEGHSKYITRCASFGDILGGTKTSKFHDISHTSHFTFTLGDLNFRTELDASLPKDVHKRAIQAMVEKENWHGLNNVDELHRALRHKMCLVGYETPLCNFPPTFKTIVQKGFAWQEKRRPSYCDRVLWKAAPELESSISPLVYEPVGDFSTSDHKPVRAAFAIDLNKPFRLRPRATRGRATYRFGKSSRVNARLDKDKKKEDVEDDQETVELFVSNINVEIFDKEGISPNPYVSLMSFPSEALKVSKGKWTKLCPWFRQRNDGKGKMRMKGWPSTSRKFSTFTPSWADEEEIGCEIKLHRADGSPLDLTGALLHFTVLDFTPAMDDSVIGTHSINLVPILSKCREQANGILRRHVERNSADPGGESNSSGNLGFRAAAKKSIMNFFKRSTSASSEVPPAPPSNSLEDPIVETEIDDVLMKNGREIGKIKCTMEAWWINSATADVMTAAKNYETVSKRRSTLSRRLSGKQRSAQRRSNLMPVQEM